MKSHKNLSSDVLKFISKFKASNPTEIEKNFLYGNCYWFATILQERFNGVIMYYPIENHFVTRIQGIEYDISGITDYDRTKGYEWNRYLAFDELDYARVYHYCVLKED